MDKGPNLVAFYVQSEDHKMLILFSPHIYYHIACIARSPPLSPSLSVTIYSLYAKNSPSAFYSPLLLHCIHNFLSLP